MTPAFLFCPLRISLGAALLVAGVVLFVVRPGIALAHHVDLHVTTSCNSYTFDADYVGGSGARSAEVRVDTVLVATFDFPGDGSTITDFYTKTGPLPANTTVQVKLFEGTTVIDTDSLTVNSAATCSTWTPTSTPTSAATETPTATHTATATTTPTNTPTETATNTATATSTGTPDSATETPTAPPTETSTPPATVTNTPPPTETNTPVPTSTSTVVNEATLTPIAETPQATATLVNEVRGLLPPDDGSGSTDNPRSEVASGLPAAGAGRADAEGLLQGAIGMVLAAIGLTVAATGLRRPTV